MLKIVYVKFFIMAVGNFQHIQAELKFAVEFLAHDAKPLVKT